MNSTYDSTKWPWEQTEAVWWEAWRKSGFTKQEDGSVLLAPKAQNDLLAIVLSAILCAFLEGLRF